MTERDLELWFRTASRAAGGRFEVWGWAKRGGRWRVKIVKVRAEELQAVVVCPLPRRRAVRHRQADLFAGD